MTIWFGTPRFYTLKLYLLLLLTGPGANDAVLPGRPQHVPLDRYKANLTKLISMVKKPASPYYSPDTRLILITAPPIIPSAWRDHCVGMWKQNACRGPEPEEDRDTEVTKRYVDACMEVAKQEGVEVVNAWTGIVEAAGGSDKDSLAPFF